MNQIECPNSVELAQFLLGKLSAADSQRLDQHFSSCGGCLAEAGRLLAEDTLTNALADRETLSQIENPKLRQVVERVTASAMIRLKEQTATSRTFVAPTEETLPQDSAKRPKLPGMEFLSPAANEDELGRLNGYRILKMLGQGGMGMVLLAEDLHLHRKVALKVIKPEIASQSDAKERFLREARTAASLNHDNIVTVYQVGEENGVVFLAMQLLEGESLQDRLKKEKQLTVRDAVKFAGQIATGLQAAHEKGLTHRDIKPDNIWLEKGNDRCKILDFGLARGADEASQITQSGMIVGTPQYLAPEQAEGRPVDQRADLFSLGVVMYRMLTGESPFARNSMMATLGAIGNHHPDPPHQLRDDVPRELSQLVMDLLEKQPDQRIDSSATFLSRLRKLIAEMKRSPERSRGDSATRAIAPLADEPMASMTMAPQASPRAQPGRRPRTGKNGGNNRGKALWLACGGGGLILLLLGIFAFSFRTTEGEWRLDVFDEDVRVIVSQNGSVVRNLHVSAGERRSVKLEIGQYQVEVLGAGSEIAISKGSVEVSKAGEVSARLALISRNSSNRTQVTSTPSDGVGGSGESTQSSRYALRFSGKPGVYVEVPSLRDLGDTYTIEGWVTSYQRASADFLYIKNNNYAQFVKFECSPETDLFGLRTARVDVHGKKVQGFNTQNAGNGVRVHFATSWDGKACRLWINGVERTAPNFIRDSDASVTIRKTLIGGTNWEGGTLLNGHIESLHFSRGTHYSNDFHPPDRFVKTENTIALYHMDEGKGDVLTDSSGNGHHGNIYGATWVELDPVTFEPKGIPREPVALSGLRFVGSDDIVRIPKLFDPDGPTTVEGWIVSDSSEGLQVLLRLWGEGHALAVDLNDKNQAPSGKRTLKVRKMIVPNMVGRETAREIPTGQLIHFAATWDGKELNLFLDGKRNQLDQHDLKGDESMHEAPATIGAFPSDSERSDGDQQGAFHFLGTLQCLRISKGVRYREDFVPSPRFETDDDTIALYRLEETQGSGMTDSSGNGYHGIVHGAEWVAAETPAATKK